MSFGNISKLGGEVISIPKKTLQISLHIEVIFEHKKAQNRHYPEFAIFFPLPKRDRVADQKPIGENQKKIIPFAVDGFPYKVGFI